MPIENQCIVYFLPFLHADIGSEFRNDLAGVEYIVSEDLTDERHYERCFRGFLGIDRVL